MKHAAYVGLGSNLQDPIAQVRAALLALQQLPQSELIKHSRLCRSPAMRLADDPKPQPDYINAVAVLSTQLSAWELLQALQNIEQQQGRQRVAQRWQSRTLDLDILLYDDLQQTDAQLQLPHPGLAERAFVLYPLADCAPNLVLPDGRTLQSLLAGCPQGDLEFIEL